jgi:CdiI immunity protein
MKGKRKNGSPAKQERSFMALRDFFSGYLHQDFRDEYASAVVAAEAFCKDAQSDELAALRKEWDVWRKELDATAPDAAATAIRKLGGVWQPQNLAELDAVGRALRGK